MSDKKTEFKTRDGRTISFRQRPAADEAVTLYTEGKVLKTKQQNGPRQKVPGSD